MSVQTTGMGTPSFSIVVEELLRLGATRLIRVGTCGGIGRGIHTGDLVVATAAAPVDGSTRTYLHGDPFAPVADFGLTRGLVDAAAAAGVTPFVGPVATVDVFYNPDADYVSKWRGRGVLGFEMEAAALFLLAGREQGAGKDVRAACALTVSDTLVRGGDLGSHLPEPRGPGARDRHHDPGRARGRHRRHRDDRTRGVGDAGLAIPVGVNLTTIAVSSRWWLESANGSRRPGISTAWAWDHFVSRGRLTDPLLECWTTLAAPAAAMTSRVRVGSFVTNVVNRHPAVLARMAMTVADLAPGRVELGIGIGGHPSEHAVYGIDFPDARERAARLEEADHGHPGALLGWPVRLRRHSISS